MVERRIPLREPTPGRLAIIAGNNNDVDYRADDTGDTLATANNISKIARPTTR